MAVSARSELWLLQQQRKGAWCTNDLRGELAKARVEGICFLASWMVQIWNLYEFVAFLKETHPCSACWFGQTLYCRSKHFLEIHIPKGFHGSVDGGIGAPKTRMSVQNTRDDRWVELHFPMGLGFRVLFVVSKHGRYERSQGHRYSYYIGP